MRYDLKNYEDAKKKADKLGKQIIIPKADELQIDIDSHENYQLFHCRLESLNFMHEVRDVKELQSPGGVGHYHIYIKLYRELPAEERVALQMFLASDPIREYLSLCLIKIGDPHPILLFEEPDFVLRFRG